MVKQFKELHLDGSERVILLPGSQGVHVALPASNASPPAGHPVQRTHPV